MGKDRKDRDKRAIETKYVAGAGWTSEIVNNNTGENHEQRLRAV